MEFFFWAILVSLLMIIAVIDFRKMIIPDRLNFLVFVLGITYILIFKPDSWRNSLAGFMLGGAFFLIIAWLTNGGMGGGDIKLIAALGLWFGWPRLISLIILAFIIGGFFAFLLLILKKVSRRDYLPLAPFIVISAYCHIFLESLFLFGY